MKLNLFGEQTNDDEEEEEDEIEKVTIEIILIVNNTNCLPYILIVFSLFPSQVPS